MMKKVLKFLEKYPAHAVFWLVLCVTGLASACQEITRIDVRFALMVQDMAKHGMGVFATVNGCEYADYPSVFVACSYLTTLGGRFLNLWSLTLPTQICGALCCALIYGIGEKLRKNAGLCGVLLLLGSWICVDQLCAFSIDLPVALAGIWLAGHLMFQKERMKCNMLRFAFALLAVFLIRGPFGVLMIGGAAGGMLLAERRWKEVLLFGITGAVMAAADAALGWKLIQLQGGDRLMQIFYDWQIGSRMAGGKYGFFYFFTNGIASYAPVTVAGVLAVFVLKKRCLNSPYAGLFGFVLLPLIMLGIPNCKHLRYMAVTLPVFALLGGIALTEFPDRWKAKALKYLELAGAYSYWLLMAAVIAFGAAEYYIDRGIPFLQLIVLIFLAQKSDVVKNQALRLACSLIAILFFGALPLQLLLEGSAEFVFQTEMRRERMKGSRLGLYGLGYDHEDLKYVFHTRLPKRSEIIYFYKCDPKTHLGRMYPGIQPELIAENLRSNDLVVCRDRDENALKERMKAGHFVLTPLVRGYMGHKKYTAFYIKKLNIEGNKNVQSDELGFSSEFHDSVKSFGL